MDLSNLDGAIWINARVLVAELSVDPTEAAKFVPPEMKMTDESKATVFIADYPETTFGSVYREAAVIMHCEDEKGAFRYCPWMVVDDDTALILGRELLGFPKKMAEIKLEETNNHVIGTVSRKGVEVMRIEGSVEAEIAQPSPVFGVRMINVFGSLIGGMKLLEIPPSSEKFKSANSVTAKVTLNSSDRDVLGGLSSPVEVDARLVTMDFGGNGELPALTKDIDLNWSLLNFFTRAN
jgi:acetoacetate decarboxylase